MFTKLSKSMRACLGVAPSVERRADRAPESRIRPIVEAILQEDISKKPDRRHFMRARVSRKEGRYVVTTTGPQGSGILNSMVEANALLIVPEEKTEVKEGERVLVQILDRSFESGGVEVP